MPVSNPIEIVFLGTGGGRVNLLSQKRSTGGFRINGPAAIHVDPGPGALLSGNRFGQRAADVQLLIVTHNHVDHVNDAGLIAEAMSHYALRKKGVIVASKSVIKGDKNNDKGISNYHLGKMQRAIVAVPGRKISLRIGGASLSLLPTPVRHEDGTGFGFVLCMGGKRIGYTSDTEYFPGLGKSFSGCDALIANSIKSSRDGLTGHLYSEASARLFSEARPKLGIITHLGMKLLLSGPGKEARRIEKLSGVRTIAAKDGMKLRL